MTKIDWNDELRAAVRAGDLARLQEVLRQEVSPHRKDVALENVASAGRADMVKCLLESGAKPLACNALYLATCSNHTEVMALLLEADPHLDSRDYYLRVACEHGHTEAAALLIKHGADVCRSDNYLLKEAVEKYELRIVTFILDHGADLNANGGMPLRLAVKKGREDIAALLLERGARPKGSDEQPLKIACQVGSADLVALLLKYKADLHANGEEALLAAARRGAANIAGMLLGHGADVKSVAEAALNLADFSYDPETIALIAGRIGNENEAARMKLEPFKEEAQALAERSPKAIRRALLDRGKPTKLLNCLAAAGFLDVLFAPEIWRKRPTKARGLYADLCEALPDYLKHATLKIDMTSYRKELPFSERFANVNPASLGAPRAR